MKKLIMCILFIIMMFSVTVSAGEQYVRPANNISDYLGGTESGDEVPVAEIAGEEVKLGVGAAIASIFAFFAAAFTDSIEIVIIVTVLLIAGVLFIVFKEFDIT
ncbi:MAG: hypothetical protein FWF94_07735 [Oscillospiraceae bacterium]|nr:hypothetical protein [Oscillospiraceae bacterium]